MEVKKDIKFVADMVLVIVILWVASSVGEGFFR